MLKTILENEKTTFDEAFKDIFKGFFSFKGNTTRKGIIVYFLFVFLLQFTTGIIIGLTYEIAKQLKITLSFSINETILVCTVILTIFMLISSVAIFFRRISDLGLNNIFLNFMIFFIFWCLFYFSQTFIAILVLIILCLAPSNCLKPHKKEKIKD